MFSALIWASDFSHFEESPVGLGVERNLILSSAHHCAREMIVTHGKFRLAAKLIFHKITQNTIKEKNQILLNIFITNNSHINYTLLPYKFFNIKCKCMR